MIASTTMRLASWLLTAKCFSEVPTPSPCTPSIQATASSPASSGSSEKYSKLRPAAGWRFRLTAGPSTTPTPSATASRPIARPTSATSSGSQVAARALPVGKQVAGSLACRSASEVLFTLRSPWGPSAIITASRPRSGAASVCQSSAPDTIATSTSSLSARSARSSREMTGESWAGCLAMVGG